MNLILHAGPDGRVCRIDLATGTLRADYFDTRSEAEAALTTVLALLEDPVEVMKRVLHTIYKKRVTPEVH